MVLPSTDQKTQSERLPKAHPRRRSRRRRGSPSVCGGRRHGRPCLLLLRRERHRRGQGGLGVVTPHVPVPGAGGGELFAADAAAGVASVAVQMVREGVSAGVALVTDRTSETAVRCREREAPEVE